MQYILWNLPYLACPDTSRRSVGSPVLERWGRSGHSETGARFVRGRSEGGSRPLFNRPRVHYTAAVVVWRRWEDGGEVGEQGEDLGALCRSTQQASKQASPDTGWYQVGASPERFRGAAGMENWGPEEAGNRSRPDQTSSCSPGGSHHHHQEMASPSPSLDTDSPLSRTIRTREWIAF